MGEEGHWAGLDIYSLASVRIHSLRFLFCPGARGGGPSCTLAH